MTASVNKFLKVLDAEPSGATDVYRGQVARVEEIVEFGTTNGQDLAGLTHGQEKLRRSDSAVMNNVVDYELSKIDVWSC
jgi:hypothetical protein